MLRVLKGLSRNRHAGSQVNQLETWVNGGQTRLQLFSSSGSGFPHGGQIKCFATKTTLGRGTLPGTTRSSNLGKWPMWASSALVLRRYHRTALLSFQFVNRSLPGMRAIHFSRVLNAPVPALVPVYALYSVGKVWLLKPLSMIFKTLSMGNAVRLYRFGTMIRRSWEYQMMRRILLTATAIAALGSIAVLVSCKFDDARAAAVLRSMPRTLGAAGWCLHSAWTYKTSLYFYNDFDDPAYREALRAAHQACAERLHHLCSQNGGIYVKAAQFIASMQTTPVEYRRELEKLQDQAKPQPFEDAKRVLEQQLGMAMEDAFLEFEPEARAAASLAQVHKAKLHDGTDVAVKVQYPGLESAVAADLGTLTVLGAVAALLFPNSFDFGWVVTRLGANLEKELDFRNEAANATRLAECMAGNPNVALPRLEAQFSGARVLTMEWVEGVKLSDRRGMVELGLRPRETALQLLKAFGQMIFLHGFVHADPHGGNVLVRPHPGKRSWRWYLFGLGWKQPQIVFLDHGLYVDLPEQLRQNYCALWCSFLVNDMETASLVGQRIAGERGGKLLPKLLKPGELASQEQKDSFKKEAGIGGLGDVGRLIEGLPEEFLQLLQISGVIRPTANKMGATNQDRLRINATYAYKGMWKDKEAVPPTLNAVSKRLYMAVTLECLKAMYLAGCAFSDLFDTLTFFPTKIAHRMYEARYS